MKFNSITVGKSGITLTYMSENAEQSVPVVVGTDENVSELIKELNKLKLICLNQLGFAPNVYLSSIGYRVHKSLEVDFNQGKMVTLAKMFGPDVYSKMESMQDRMSITGFKMLESQTTCSIKAEFFANLATIKEQDEDPSFFSPSKNPTKVSFGKIGLLDEVGNEKTDFCLFAPTILDVFNNISELARPFYAKYSRSVQQDVSEDLGFFLDFQDKQFKTQDLVNQHEKRKESLIQMIEESNQDDEIPFR